MKQLLLTISFLLLALLSSIQSKASHISGADLTYQCTSTPGIFKATLILYRQCDASSIPFCTDTCGASCEQILTVSGGDATCLGSVFGTVALTLQNVRDNNPNPYCPSAKSVCTNMGCIAPGSYTPGIERYEFTGYINIGPTSGIPASCCNVVISYSQCCRRGDITSGAAGENFYTEAVINRCHSVTPCNSAPVFTNDPYAIICGGENFVFNNGAVDPDLDSLSYSFVPALQATGASITYTAPFSYNTPMPWTGSASGQFPAGIHCDAVTGDIRFSPPNSPFSGVMAIEVKQWKKMNKMMTVIGKTRRDIQMIVRDDCLPNNPPRLLTSPPHDGIVNVPKTQWQICASEQLCFTVTARDTDFHLPLISDTTYLSWNAALATYGATFTPDYDITKRHLLDSLGGGPREDVYKFCWTPTENMGRSTPYAFTVSAKDNRCPNPGRATTSFFINVLPKPLATILKSIDTCGMLNLSYYITNSTPIASSLWIVEPVQGSAAPRTFGNTNSIVMGLKDTGFYKIKLALSTSSNPMLGCSNTIEDSIYISNNSLYDSISFTPPICKYSNNGSIEVFAQNGVPPYQYALNQQAFGSSNHFTSLTQGSYSIKIKDSRGCTTQNVIDLKGRTLVHQIINGDSSVAIGDTITYTGSFPLIYNTLWSVTNGTIVSGQHSNQIQVAWNQSGTGNITLMVTDSICYDTAFKNITIAGSTGLATATKNNGITVFPNPAQSFLTIQIENLLENTSIQLYNVLGQLLLEQQAEVSQQLNIETLPKGMYFLKIGEWTQRVVKQ